MKLVTNINELQENIGTIEKYLNSADVQEREYAINLIKKGTCFIAYESDGMTRFVPSRYIGYAKNSLTNHENNRGRDGRDTNPAISAVLRAKAPLPDAKLDELYKKYCVFLGFSPRKAGSFGAPRKYWKLS